VVDCNPAFEALFGYTQAEAIGRDLDSLVASAEEIDEAAPLTDAVRRGEHVRRITQRLRKDGSSVTVEAFGLPVVLWGKQIGVLALYHDVSELMLAKIAAPRPPPGSAIPTRSRPR
jgi:PAS domain S-box-containing protein